MIDNLFKFESDRITPEAIEYDNIILIKEIGSFPIGTTFDLAYIEIVGQEMQLHLCNYGEERASQHGLVFPLLHFGIYRLGCSVEEVIDEPQG